MTAFRPDSRPEPPASRQSTRLFVAGLGIGQIVSWGSLYYSFPQIAEALGADLGYSKASLYGAASLGLLVAALASYPVGAAVDQGYGRRLLAGGSGIAGLLLISWSLVDSLTAIYLILAGVGLAQSTLFYEPAFAVIVRRLGTTGARRGIAALTLWGGFASAVFIPLTQMLLDNLGWRGALGVLGSVNLLICLPLHLWLVDPSRDAISNRAPTPEQRTVASTGPLRQALRSSVFWALALALIAYTGVFSALTFHLYPLLLERGLPTASVVTALALIGPSQVAGRIVVLAVAPRASSRLIGSLVVVAFPVVIVILRLAPAPGFALAACIAVLYGVANGIMTIVRGLAVPDMISGNAYGTLNGALTAPSLLAKAAAPAAAAGLWQLYGSYDAVLSAMLLTALIMCAGFWAAAARSRSVT
jgi:predicted MFS family arabinose efflux permease